MKPTASKQQMLRLLDKLSKIQHLSWVHRARINGAIVCPTQRRVAEWQTSSPSRYRDGLVTNAVERSMAAHQLPLTTLGLYWQEPCASSLPD